MKKTKHNDYEKDIIFPVFVGYRVHIVFTDDIRKSRIARYGNDGLSEDAAALHCTAQKGNAHLIFDTVKATPSILVHECWHAVHGLLEWAGADFDNEVVAYHLGYLFQFVFDFWLDVPGPNEIRKNFKRYNPSKR
jgi:hypothetical protein